jgi:hypothetical protein
VRCAKALLVTSKEELNAFVDKKGHPLAADRIRAFVQTLTGRNYIYYNLLFFCMLDFRRLELEAT